MKRAFQLLILAAAVTLTGCFGETNTTQVDETQEEQGYVTLYTHRHYDVDKQLYQTFTEKTGIKVNVVKAKAGELLVRLEKEGKNSPADLLMTVDAGRLVQAKQKGLLQTVNSEFLNTTVPANLRDADGQWYAMTKRARIIVYSKDRVNPEELTTYEALATDQWAGRVLVRSSSNMYNQSLMAALINHLGPDSAQAWATGVVGNMAQDPKGNDRDQVKFIAAGHGDVALVNTYYIGKLLNSEDLEEIEAGKMVGVFFPNQDGRGAHINVSGAGVTANAPNKENAIKLLEFLASEEAQKVYAEANFEYPVNANVAPSELLQSWGDFKEDNISLSLLGEANAAAIEVFEAAGWK